MCIRAASTEREPYAEKWADADDMKWAARHWASHIEVRLGHIHVRQMRTKWASISSAGRLTLNTDLLSIPKRLGDYVIVHELVHLLAPNHGKVYRSFLLAYMSDWQERERELQEYASVEGGEDRSRL